MAIWLQMINSPHNEQRFKDGVLGQFSFFDLTPFTWREIMSKEAVSEN